jgi:copper(I)-binding protein
MLMDLKAPLAKGSNVPLTLVFKNAQGAESQLKLEVPVAAQSPAMPSGHGMHGKH